MLQARGARSAQAGELQARGARQQARGAAGRGSRRGRARGVRPGRGWVHGLAVGCALDALGPFSIRFDSIFSRVKFFGHCS